MWNQGFNIDSGIQTAAPSIKGKIGFLDRNF